MHRKKVILLFKEAQMLLQKFLVTKPSSKLLIETLKQKEGLQVSALAKEQSTDGYGLTMQEGQLHVNARPWLAKESEVKLDQISCTVV